MKKSILLLAFFALFFVSASSQTFNISGKIIDKQNTKLFGAGISILKQPDSSFIKGMAADMNGEFLFQGMVPGKYIIKVSFMGYDNFFVDRVIIKQSISLGTLTLNDKASILKSVNVVDNLITTTIKGDSTQYNAGAFKTNSDANAEDLINKMPGFTTVNNKTQAQNEDVKKVLVNGKPFFGDDPNAVLKNIPADIIDKIQIYDEKSDQSQFTGFDDGNTTKTINIITKTQFKDGTFGKVYAGYGFNDKWKGGFNLNFFKDDRRITILAQSNNINDQNFSTEDLLGVTGSGGGGKGSKGRGGSGQYGQDNGSNNFLVDQKNGISTTNSIGINYVNKWKKVDISASYFFNYTDNKVTSDLFRQYFASNDSGATYTENSIGKSTNMNHRANMKLDWKIDSLNSFTWRPKISYQQNDGSNNLSGKSMQSGELFGSTVNDYTSNLTGINISSPLLYRHSFLKKKRTFSINITPGYNQNKGDNYLNTYTNFLNDTLATDTINQLSNLNKYGIVLSSSISYTEPITEKSQLLFTYGVNYNNSSSNKETYNYSPILDIYNSFDSVFSNKFTTNYLSQSIGTNYRFQKEKWNLTAGIAYQQAQLKSEQLFPYQYYLDKTFNSFLPNAMFQYKYSAKKNIRISYRSSNNAPSVIQLQNVINNTNPLQLSVGNPDLVQDWQNNINIRYSSINTVKSTGFFVMLSGTYTQDYISNQTLFASHDTLVSSELILTNGSQLTKPINLNGYYNIRSFVNYSFTLPKIKSNLNLNIGGTYTGTPGLINNTLNTANNLVGMLGIVLSSNISEKIDFTIGSNSSYSNITNTLQKNLNNSYLNQNSKLKIQVMPWKGLVIQTDIAHQYYSGLSQNFNQNYLLWNAAIGYKFLKDKAAELRLSVYDILKQNTNITRNSTETYYEDIQTNVMQRYLMLTFTYNLKVF